MTIHSRYIQLVKKSTGRFCFKTLFQLGINRKVHFPFLNKRKMNFPVNPKLKECLKTESASRFLDELDVPAVYSHPVVFETNDNNIFYSIPKLSHRQNWIAAFDVDWTLAYSEKH